MKAFSFGLAAMLFVAATMNVLAQGTTISYQGQLGVSGAPANTNYDFRFAVYDAVTNGNRISISLTNAAVPVSNGLFSVTLNFSNAVFNGTDNGSNDWMDIGVRAVGAANFTALYPRQPILPVPYAQFATAASNLLGSLVATQLTGTISSTAVSGSYSNTVNFVNGTNTFAGTFSGNGAGLTNLNGSSIASGTVADVRLSSNVALLNANQTFTGSDTFAGANLFSNTNTFNGTGNYNGANTFSNWNNSFTGSFFGNGLVGWVAVPGNTQSAVRDHGYMETNPLYTTITLPQSPLTNGDIVRISGGGPGGWCAALNSGQSILGNFASFSNSFPVPLLTGASYTGVAASADGVHMFAVGPGFTGIKASSDSGGSFLALTAPQVTGNYYYSIACSANGRIVYAEPVTNATTSYVQKSTDGGTTWSATTTVATGCAMACSSDGSKLILYNNSGSACSGSGTYFAELSGGTLFIVTNGVLGYFTVTTPVTMNCLAASSDCTRLVAGASPGLLYGSSDQGGHWTALTTTNQYWSGAWMSPDGTHIAAAAASSGGLIGCVFSSVVTVQPNIVSSNGISGSQGSSVELQYLGNGQFMPVSSTGVIWAY